MDLIIRQENKADYSSIKNVNDHAFGQPHEEILVEKLRRNQEFREELSLIAEQHRKVVGHILFFPIRIIHSDVIHASLALAPMLVLPEFQRKGIGSMLVTSGLEAAASLGFTSVIVLGHATYYPQFGFVPASKFGIRPPFDVPDEVFMAMQLSSGVLSRVQGIVEYPDEFLEVS